MSGQKVQHGVSEDVIAIAGDHVPCAANIDELNLREAGEKLVGALLADKVTHLAPHEKHRYLVGATSIWKHYNRQSTDWPKRSSASPHALTMGETPRPHFALTFT
jgi:hypothetical protein